DGAAELVGLEVLQQEATRPGPQRAVDVLVDLVRRDDHDAGAAQRGVGADLGGRLDPVEAGHADVHQHDVRPGPADHGEGVQPVGRLADDLDLGLAVDRARQDRPEALPDQRLVVGKYDADGHDRPSSGNEAWTAQPPVGAGPAVTVPPTSATRSRIPASPNPKPPVPEPAAPPSSTTQI